MNELNQFFKRIYSSPSLLWKIGAGLLFIFLSLLLLFSPSLIYGFDRNTEVLFAVLLLLYGIFRLFTFYVEYKRKDDEE